MEITIANLSEEDRQKLEYIQQKTNQNLPSSLSEAIDAYYQKLQDESDPLARLKRSPAIASFQGSPDLAEKSEEIFHALVNKEQWLSQIQVFS